MAAAVSDFAPIEYSELQNPKNTAKRTLHLAKTIDILKTMGERKQGQFIVGFAAESENLEANANAKLHGKTVMGYGQSNWRRRHWLRFR